MLDRILSFIAVGFLAAVITAIIFIVLVALCRWAFDAFGD